jgi:seryl-tRNA synthetase
MTDANLGSSGTETGSTSGTPADDSATPKKDTVAYETHLKLLGEKKKLQAEVERLRLEQQEKLEAELKAKEDFKKLAEMKEQEAKEAKQRVSEFEAREKNAMKLDAFLSTLQGTVDKKFWGHIPLDKIVIHPETGEVDMMSVTQTVEWFSKEYYDIVKRAGGPTTPNTAPQGGSSALTYEEWRKLPLAEQKARMKEVMAAEKLRGK